MSEDDESGDEKMVHDSKESTLNKRNEEVKEPKKEKRENAVGASQGFKHKLKEYNNPKKNKENSKKAYKR